ncbi:MAG TPA: hypothetical protein VF950_16730 [Planctomycetota bacterium]
MTQPVSLSDELVIDARLTGEVLKRSIAEQIELWASLGRSLEPLLRGDQALALQRAGRVRPLSECLRGVDTPEGRKRVALYLEQKRFPHYEPAPGRPGLVTRVEQGGKRVTGRFVNRKFQRAD